jgi:predicted nuclease of predicted toxin-antitoxin system
VIGLLLDAGLPRSAAAELRDGGWDVEHVADIGLGAAKDEEIMAAAEHQGRVVVTLDHDFPYLLFLEGAAKPSVVLLRMEGLDGPRAVEVLRSLLPRVTDELSSGAIVSVDWSGARVRRLPVR